MKSRNNRAEKRGDIHKQPHNARAGSSRLKKARGHRSNRRRRKAEARQYLHSHPVY